ncbi:heme biosynthesis protein HemY [Defluviimonas sp. WL0002]|uniref:Heme biosynthesis protein HemY n=1 Tax=Albidovulum marisflavi TaxID=2984159 RepID=A0ABT2Z843_9RHOB|nr:heme biosynthesis HemY N-terminal domain-containing protein [Defluviimonas sp. WL0002]MCV2867242.1 heme biosynthesis protein HemY [Defluviimonas sp. WL0002]
MIWSFIKIVVFVAVVAALTLLAGHLADQGSGLRLIVANTEFTLGPLQAAIAAVLLVILVWIALRILGLLIATLHFLNGDETAISRYFNRNRERKGFEALAEGMMAIASGDGRVAMAKAARAEKFLGRPELTNLLTAQAAELAGDTRRATAVYKRLLADDRTRFVGVRGLMMQKLGEGDTETALKLAEKAFSLNPRSEDVQDTLFRLQTGTGDWRGARKILSAKHKQGLLPRDVHIRRDAVLALQEAREVFDEEASIEAREAAIAANKASPDLIPAAAMAARGYIEKGKPKLAHRILVKAWSEQPHPDLAAAFAAIAPDETPQERLKRFEALIAARPDHEESRLLKAELNIAAEDFPAARRAMGALAQAHPTARALTIMAAIERGEGSPESVVRGWLARALTASRGPQWVCDKCHNIESQWSPVCNNCGGFDTFTWREPEERGSGMTAGAAVLPLIVGERARSAPEPRDRIAPAADYVVDDEAVDQLEAEQEKDEK